VSAAQEDREKFIIDGDNEEGNDCAQSDLVRVALNLAFVPNNENLKHFSKSVVMELKQNENKATI